MSQRERDRLKVLHEVEKGQLRQQQAAVQLGLTDRWVRKLLGRLRTAVTQLVAGGLIALAAGEEQGGASGVIRAPIVVVADGGSSRFAVQLGLHRDDRRPGDKRRY